MANMENICLSNSNKHAFVQVNSWGILWSEKHVLHFSMAPIKSIKMYWAIIILEEMTYPDGDTTEAYSWLEMEVWSIVSQFLTEKEFHSATP